MSMPRFGNVVQGCLISLGKERCGHRDVPRYSPEPACVTLHTNRTIKLMDLLMGGKGDILINP